MREFQVYFKGVYIGRLVIDENGRYLYYLMDHAKTCCFLFNPDVDPALYIEQKEFGPPIPYFQVRVDVLDRFKRRSYLFNTDDVQLKDIT